MNGKVKQDKSVRKSSGTGAELEQERIRYRDLIDALPFGIICLDYDLYIRTANSKAAAVFGLTGEKLPGISILKFIYHDDHLILRDKCDASTGPAGKTPFRIRLAKDDGAYLLTVLEIRFPPGDNNGPEIWINSNPTRRYSGSAQSSSAPVEHVGFAIKEIICDSDGAPLDFRFMYVNKSFETLTGIFKEQVTGKTALEIMPDIDPNLIARYGTVALGGGYDHFETYLEALGKYLEIKVFSMEHGRFAVVFTDVGKNNDFLEARFRIREYAESHSIPGILKKALGESVMLSGSKTGFVHMPGQNGNTFSLNVWSQDPDQEHQRRSDNEVHTVVTDFNSLIRHILVKSPVIHNDPDLIPYKNWLPSSHPVVSREMIIPVVNDDQVMAIFIVGNRSTDYTIEDAQTLSKFTRLVWDDIEKKLTEESLTEQRLLNRSILDKSPMMLVLKDINGFYIEANDSFCRFLGKSREEILGRTDFDLFPDDEAVAYIIEDKKVLEEKGSVRSDQYVSGINGSRWLNVTKTAYLNTKGESAGVLCSVSDITERKAAEENLKISIAKYEALFNAYPVGIIVTDSKGFIIESNEMAAKLTGFLISEYANKNITDAFRDAIWPDGSKMTNDEYPGEIAFRENRVVENIELGIRRPDGGVSWISVSAAPLKVEDYGVVITFSDFTRRKKAEDDLTKLNEELERRISERTNNLKILMEELESFAYSVSHDLRAPLRAIDGYLQIIEDEHGSSFEQESLRLFKAVKSNAKKMDTLITNLLQLSRVSRDELIMTILPMNRIVRLCFNELATTEEKKLINFTVSNLTDSRGDMTLLSQVWSNLIQNAIKFTRPVSLRQITIGSYSDQGMIVYFIKDNGVGFNQEYAGKLFTIFQRLHKESDFEGTGIGLAIVKRVITRHGGRVWAESGTGGGAVFYFSLPE